MYCRVIACDFDGTGAIDGHPAPELYAALAAARWFFPAGSIRPVGIRRALDELGRSERNLIAFGDAENDVSMLVDAEVGVAAQASVPAISALADDSIAQPGGAGVALYILLEQGRLVTAPARRLIRLGKTAAGSGVALPVSENWSDTGRRDSRSGRDLGPCR